MFISIASSFAALLQLESVLFFPFCRLLAWPAGPVGSTAAPARVCRTPLLACRFGGWTLVLLRSFVVRCEFVGLVIVLQTLVNTVRATGATNVIMLGLCYCVVVAVVHRFVLCSRRFGLLEFVGSVAGIQTNR